MSLREWLVVLGIIIIAAVVVDGLRRIRRARQDSKEIAEGMGSQAYHSPVEENFNPELPSGNFRVVRKGEDSIPPTRDEPPLRSCQSEQQVNIQPQAHSADESRAGNSFSTAVDSIKETLREGESGFAPGRQADSAKASEDKNDVGIDNFSALDKENSELTNELPMTSADSLEAEAHDRQQRSAKTQQDPQDSSVTKRLKATGDDFKERFLQKITSAHVAGSKAAKAITGTKTSPANGNTTEQQPDPENDHAAVEFDEVIVVNVLAANDAEYDLGELKGIAEACGMQLGEMSIYHRHEYDFGKGPVQFSMANALPPGTFTEESGSSPGVCFFVRLPGPDESMQALEYMIETAQVIVRHLGGELKDENHSVMTPQTIEHCRHRVREFERRKLSPRV